MPRRIGAVVGSGHGAGAEDEVRGEGRALVLGKRRFGYPISKLVARRRAGVSILMKLRCNRKLDRRPGTDHCCREAANSLRLHGKRRVRSETDASPWTSAACFRLVEAA